MRRIFLFLILSLTSLFSFSQKKYKVSFEQLKAFEGVYEFTNPSTLKIAASPKDTLLYAIISKSKYPLRPIGKDLFLNATNDKVRFFRNDSNTIAGYTVDKQTYKLLSRHVFFPKTLWYPRLNASKHFHYVYHQPENLNDHLLVGNITHTGLDTVLLGEMMRKIVDGIYPDVHSILIIKDGKLVFEEYFYEFNRDSLHQLRSASKSFVSALTGIAIDKGFIKNINEKVIPLFPEYKISNMSADKERITIKDLLTQQTGLDYDISNPNTMGNETKMDYSEDWVKYTLDLPMVDSPGGKGMYASGNPIILGRIIEKATKEPLPEFARQTLFSPLGITTYKWSFKPDRSSAETFCQLYLRPRDMAKFGLLYLDKGNWNGKQIISSKWVKESLLNHSVIQGVNYGYLWWNKYLDAHGVRYYSHAAQGNGGQKIYIFEKQNMVIVITGGNYNKQSPSDELIRKYILPAFNKK